MIAEQKVLPPVPKRIELQPVPRPYVELANSIGFCPGELVYRQLMEYFVANNMGLYDYKEVARYLTAEAEKIRQAKNATPEEKKTIWVWRPLRPKDEITEFGWWDRDQGELTFGDYDCNDWLCRYYDRLVPEMILRKVAAIEKKFGENVKFFVTDFGVVGDPFIMVIPAMHCPGDIEESACIFGGWNEPGFGDNQ